MTDQAAHERAEIARILARPEKPSSVAGMRPLALVVDSDGSEMGRLLKRAQEAQARLLVAKPDPAREEAHRVDERRRRITSSGFQDVDAVDILARALVPPVVEGHDGSRDSFSAAASFLVSDRVRTLTLAGRSGTGKTYAAGWCIAATEDAYWMPASAYHQEAAQWSRIRARAAACPLLVVSDLGREASIEWHSGRIVDLISERHDQRRRTIITTNAVALRILGDEEQREKARRSLRVSDAGLDALTIEGRYGITLADRMGDTTLSVVCKCRGESLRQRRT